MNLLKITSSGDCHCRSTSDLKSHCACWRTQAHKYSYRLSWAYLVRIQLEKLYRRLLKNWMLKLCTIDFWTSQKCLTWWRLSIVRLHYQLIKYSTRRRVVEICTCTWAGKMQSWTQVASSVLKVPWAVNLSVLHLVMIKSGTDLLMVEQI